MKRTMYMIECPDVDSRDELKKKLKIVSSINDCKIYDVIYYSISKELDALNIKENG